MLLPLLFLALAPDDTVKRQEIPLLLRPFEITTSRSLGLVAKSTVSLEKIDSLQPLAGLSEEAVRAALKPFDVSEEFVNIVLQRGAV